MAKNILSISSHVVHGYVGNRATVFPLQYYGWDVDAVNTTNFSNHPGYGSFEGKPSSAELVEDIFSGLKDILNVNDNYDMILTGYTPGDKVLEVIYQQLSSIFNGSNNKSKLPIWIVDPVLGDNGRLYVSENVIPIYKKIFSSGFVTLTSPNQFEFETLTDTTLTNWESVVHGLHKFYQLYKVPNVVISSAIIDGKMYSIGYSNPDNATPSVFYIPINEIECNFSGCGDLFTALLANAFYENNKTLSPLTLSTVLIKLNLILHHSYKEEQQATGQEVIKVVKDIRIISSRHYLLQDIKDNDFIDNVHYL